MSEKRRKKMDFRLNISQLQFHVGLAQIQGNKGKSYCKVSIFEIIAPKRAHNFKTTIFSKTKGT
jgi:hypothetical protein